MNIKPCVRIHFNEEELEFYGMGEHKHLFGLTLPSIWKENDKELLIKDIEIFLEELEKFKEYEERFKHLLEELKHE